ncbi:MAG: S-layer homology domain-containing protein [Propioniciclava sp.]|uniref:RCC1 domain-containing protein n=1 Tax=Propioniciclava sp. TaxID=2038686 RepID=UPI0039E37353
MRGIRVLVGWITGVMMGVGVIMSPVAVAATPGFTDVPPGTKFYDEIMWLAENGISTGWDVGGGRYEYRPLQPVARDAMAAFMYRLAGSPAFTAPSTSPFSDVPPSALFYKEMAWLAGNGISTGWDVGGGRYEYRPLQPVARDAMAAFMYRLAGSPAFTAPSTSPFSDVPPSALFYKEMAWLAGNGISTGWDVGGGRYEYRPLQPVARDAMAAFMYRLDDKGLVPDLHPEQFQAINASRFHTCGLTIDGAVKCWGRNEEGQLGDGTTTNRHKPVQVVGLTGGVKAITGTGNHTCALTASGAVKCWGYGGALGNGTPIVNSPTPVQVIGLTGGVTAIAGGDYHTCALTSGGAVKCWGSNEYGEIGDGTQIARRAPVQVSGLTSGVTALASGTDHTCAITSTGTVMCWGYNGYGQLGEGSTTYRMVPVQMTVMDAPVSTIVGGHAYTCVLTTAGAVKCWGTNAHGQLGEPSATYRRTPVQVSGLTSGVASIEGGSRHICVVTTSGAAKCWGDDESGQLGDGAHAVRFVPTQVSGLTSGVAAISAGADHTCAVMSDGTAKCWGYNKYGLLGDGTTVNRNKPVDVKTTP